MYVIYMSFCKMVFYLKDAHIMILCNHAPLHKLIYSVTRNDKVNNWSQEIHSITLCIEFEHIKGKENILADRKPMNFLKNRTIFNSRDKLSPVLQHSFLRSEMLILTILYTHERVSVNLCPVILFWTPYFWSF